MPPIKRFIPGLAVLALFFSGLVPRVEAIDIVPIYNAGASVEPSIDPTGALLTSIFDYAETFYQGVFEDTHTITINFWWADLSPGFLGLHNLVSQSSAGRVTESNIRIDTRDDGGAFRNWFIDSTPSNNSEFNMSQTLWRDLSPSQQSDFFNFGANIPATFEAGYTGSAVGGGPAAGAFDLLSVVLHEVGHAMGLTGTTLTNVQTADGDYDFLPSLVFGRTLAAEVSDDPYHLADDFALMDDSIGTGRRELPSHTDLFAMAAANGYGLLDVPRREFYGGTNWNTSGNWSGNQVPGSNDDAFVRNAGATVTSSLSDNGFAANLTVAEGSNVSTQGFKLDVGGTVTITDTFTDVNVPTGGELEAATIVVQDGGDLNVDGGLVDVNTLTISTGVAVARLTGTGGTVDVQSALINNGTIQPLSSGTFTFTSTGGAVWNLDGNSGTGVGIVNATTGNINFASGSLTDAFDGTMTIGDFVNARTLTMANNWTLATNGTLNMVGGNAAAERAALNGSGELLAQGTINANFGVNHVNSPMYLNGATVNAPGRIEFNGATSASFGTLNAGPSGAIVIDGTTTYLGGSNSVTGLVQQNGNATVQGATVFAGERIDMDGASGATVWTIRNSLQLDVDAIDTGTLNQFDGTLNLTSIGGTTGKLHVNLPPGTDWTMAGTMNINSGTTQTNPSLVTRDVNLTGTTHITAATAFQANAHFVGPVNFLANGSRLSLQEFPLSATTLYSLEGATIGGPAAGTLEGRSNVTLKGRGTIASAVDFRTGSFLLASGGTLNLTGNLLDLGTIGTKAEGLINPILNVSNTWNTAIATELHLQGGRITGASIVNGGRTRGFGEIVVPGFQNDGILSADGGQLTLTTTSLPDLDGFFNNGVVNALNGGPLLINSPAGTIVFRGTMNITGFPAMINIPNAVFHNQGTVNLQPGDLNAKGILQDGTLKVGAGLSQLGEYFLGGGIRFASGSTTTLQGGLQLVGNATVDSGATISGGGELIVYAGSHLNLADGADVQAPLVNHGTLEVGDSPGAAAVAMFSQLAGGTFIAEIDGLQRRSEYDQLEVVSAASLAGDLRIELNQNGGSYADPLTPGTYDAFSLIVGNGITGTFDTVQYDGQVLAPTLGGGAGDLVSLAACGLFRIVDYSPESVDLLNYRALPGDANADGVVDGQDFVVWNSHKFTTGTDWTRGDFNCDGLTDGQDFVVWNSFKFTSVPLPLTTGEQALAANLRMIPEPSGVAALWGAAVAVAFRRRSRTDKAPAVCSPRTFRW